MLTQGVKEIVCSGDSKNFQEVVTILSTDGDKFIDTYREEDVIFNTVQYINKLYPETKDQAVDMLLLFAGNAHGHLVAFFRGCSGYIVNMDMQGLHNLLEILK